MRVNKYFVYIKNDPTCCDDLSWSQHQSLLRHFWGVVDLQDCASIKQSARLLGENQQVDPTGSRDSTRDQLAKNRLADSSVPKVFLRLHHAEQLQSHQLRRQTNEQHVQEYVLYDAVQHQCKGTYFHDAYAWSLNENHPRSLGWRCRYKGEAAKIQGQFGKSRI